MQSNSSNHGAGELSTTARDRARIVLLICVLACATLYVVTLWTAQASRGTGPRGFVEYVPVYFTDRNPMFAEDRSMNTPEHQAAMTRILAAYQQSFIVQDGKLYISPRLSRDQELLMNFTSKAELVAAGRGEDLLR